MQREIRPAAERLVQFYQIGGSGPDTARRKVGTNVLPVPSGGQSSWSRFLTHPATTPIPYYSPTTLYNWGIRRLHLHNPFGTTTGYMRLDQYILADEGWKENDINYQRVGDLVDDFVETWEPVINGGSGGLGDPVEVCAYVGALNVTDVSDVNTDFANERFKSLYDAENFSSLENEINRSLAPLMNSGMTIGADAAVGTPDDGYEFDFYEKLRNGTWKTDWSPTRVYVESRPRADKPKWANFDVLIVDSFQHDYAKLGCIPAEGKEPSWWYRSNPDSGCPQSKSGNPPKPWGIATRFLSGERVRLVTTTSGVSIQKIVEKTRRALLQGDTVLMNLRPFIENNISFSSLIEGVDDYIASRGPMPDETQPGYKTRNAAQQSTLVELINNFRNLI
jgi:hypothetical protein